MLPHEAEVATAIATKYRIQLAAMTALHDTVVSMLTSGSWTIRNPKGLNSFVVQTMMGLLTKASKAFRASQLLCERGLHDEAQVTVRVLMETTVAISFILQKQTNQRTLIYHAHGLAQSLKMLNEWKKTPGLKRKATAAMLKQANAGLAAYLAKLPLGTDVKGHWSGRANLFDAVKSSPRRCHVCHAVPSHVINRARFRLRCAVRSGPHLRRPRLGGGADGGGI